MWCGGSWAARVVPERLFGNICYALLTGVESKKDLSSSIFFFLSLPGGHDGTSRSDRCQREAMAEVAAGEKVPQAQQACLEAGPCRTGPSSPRRWVAAGAGSSLASACKAEPARPPRRRCSNSRRD